ncbi:MAG: transcription antitermination factor NusB [Minisyncoccota bacterium]
MANRHLSRSIVLQSLFEWDFRNENFEEGLTVFKRNVDEFAPGQGDLSFMESLFRGVLEKQKDLDLIIEKAAPEWPIDKISVMDRNILRQGLFELLFSDRTQVPPKVAINEAIELAKSFGSDTSSKFVNGVLGAVYKEIGEPGKEETTKDKKKTLGPIPIEYLGGAVVYAKVGEDIYVALVHDVFGRWTLSKGHIAGGEDQSAEVALAITDELSLPVTIKDKLGTNEYATYHPEKGKIKKNVTYYLAEAPFEDIKLVNSGGLDDARWFKLGDILDLNFYNDILPLITKAVNILVAK